MKALMMVVLLTRRTLLFSEFYQALIGFGSIEARALLASEPSTGIFIDVKRLNQVGLQVHKEWLGNSLLRILYVAAFAVSGYASTDGRHCKPFNPMLGETYEADYPEKGLRFFSEKVSHHPTLIACHCEGKGWKFWGDSNLRSKFWGRSIQLDPLGTLTLEFDDFTCIRVHGFVEDDTGEKVATLRGKWDEHMYYTLGDRVSKTKDFSSASLLWKRKETPPNLTRYNLTPFAITLNELTPGLQEKRLWIQDLDQINDIWKMGSTTRQMKRSKAKKQVKRKYVTAHHLQQQQRKKKPVHVEEAEKISTRKSPRLNKLQANTDATVTNRPASARRKLDLQDISHEDEHMGENDHIEDDLPPPPPPPPLTPADKKIVMRLKDYEKHMTDYEKQRAINVKKNNKVLIALKLPTLAAGMKKANSKIIKGKEKVQNDEDYVPEPAEEQSANERTKKLEKTKFFSGPTTRSRANDTDTKDATEKEASSLIPEVPANIELSEAPVGQGSMADFLALRKSQKENAKKAVATENAPITRKVGADSSLPDYEDDEDNEAQVVCPKRLRGETRMDKVHTRSFENRVVIDMNERSGALAQTFGSSTCGIHSALQNLLVSGAEKLTDSLLDVTRKQHFDKANVTVASKLFLALVNVILMDTVKDTVLANERWVPPPGKGSLYIRPLLMGSGSVLSLAPAPEFTFLIYVSPVGNYFKDGLSPIDLMVETETHRATPGGTGCVKTIGNYAAKKKRPDDGEPSQGRVFIKTRKRRAGRKYQTDPSVINYRIEKIKKNIDTSGEDIQELITDGKLHGPFWLIGRSSNPSKISATPPKGTYVQDLTSKIRESLVEEVEAKVSKKMQEEVDAQSPESRVPAEEST
ncbi:hypothetical protein POM88_042321 [Heracleum sosnowskyi]|uniref:Uncharacterized protein n=1 Tax=Heracleum sosnowskyi TaxID=360622 RepID=A0AAD8HIM8_9APIA|nr:hypothetical protein POM88_042321 [Heracleum sosnowskyi]